MMRKRASAGESIGETLVAVLLLSLIFLMLTGAVTSAARLNASLRNEDVTFSAGVAQTGAEGWRVNVRMGAESRSYHAELFRSGGSEDGHVYYYYEYTP